MRDKIEKVFIDFDNGVRPSGFREPKRWYVLNSEGKLYPAKAIWALVNDCALSSFNTKEALVGFAQLEYSIYSNSTPSQKEEDFDEQVRKSSELNTDLRKKRLQNANRYPVSYSTVVTQFKRNPDVVAEVLERAKGHCEHCEQPAPFIRQSNGTPYLEVHHIIQLSQGGEDTVENAVALCPNCHRKAHFGI